MKKNKLIAYAKEFIFVLIFMSILSNILSIYKSQSLNKEPLQQVQFKLIDNTAFTIDTHKPLLIHFWASWCPTCKLEASNIEFLSKYYNVVTVAVNSGSDYEIEKYLREKGLNIKVVNDKNSLLSKKFNIQVYPTTFIYDHSQNLVFSEVGYTSTFGLLLRMWWVDFLK